MNPIRPPVQPAAQGITPERSDATKLAAQRAFFEAALGRAQAPAAAAPQAAPPPVQTAAAPSQAGAPQPATAAEAPQRILRPGSLIDIRV